MAHLHLIPVTPISKEAFMPFGRIIAAEPAGPEGRPITARPLESCDLAGGQATILTLTFTLRDFTFTHMEQHGSFTQAFLPADGKPAIVVVARPANGAGSPPDIDDLHAFLLDGSQGILLSKGVWHCPLFPLNEESSYVVVTCRETPADSEGYLNVAEVSGREYRLSLQAAPAQ